MTMTMNYCGRCGSANGTTARFCRQCGAELGGQTAISSSSAPLNVEFSTKSAIKNPGRENHPSPPENRSPESDSRNQPQATSTKSEGGDQDPKAISESLRRIRTSGPLIIEAIKQKNDRINEIINQAVQGMSENKADARREERPAPPPPPPPPAVQKGKKGDRPANQKTKSQAARQTNAGASNVKSTNPGLANTGSTNSRSPNVGRNHQAGVQAAPQTAPQTLAAVAPAQSTSRKTSGFLPGPMANRLQPLSASNAGQLPPNGPSTVLAQASGFKPQSSFGPKVLIGLIAIAVLLAAGIYFPFRDKLLIQAHMADSNRNLVSPEEQSAQLVRLGQQERAQGRFDAAKEHFQQALGLAPNNPNTQFLLAQTYQSAGQMDEALRGYQQILRIAPEHLEARLQLAEIYRARGNWNAAYKEYRNIIELNQSSPQAAAALNAIEKQQAEEQAEEQKIEVAALKRNRAAQQVAPALPGALPGSVVREQVPLLSQRINTPSGINPPAALSGARSEERPDPRALSDAHKKLGVRYLNVREFRAAINEFLQALRLTPDDKDLYYFIGSSYHGLGQFAEAYDYYRRVDTGPYVGPAQSGSKQTEKAAREAYKRRDATRFQTMKDDTDDNKASKSIMNRIMDTFRE